MRFCVWFCALFLYGTINATAGEWSEFRGPSGQGHAEVSGLPLTWSESENVRWKVPVPGTGWSSPVVSGNRIYLTAAVPLDASAASRHSLRVLCLNAADGAEIWNVEAFVHPEDVKVEIHGKNSHASPTPILQGDRLYVHFGPHGTACLKTDGSFLWKTNRLTYAPQHGTGGSPALIDDRLIICCDGRDVQYVAALDCNTGDVLWKTDRNCEASRGFSFATPKIIQVAGKHQAVCPGSGAVCSYDPATGRELWRVSYGEGYSVVPRPVFGNGLVYVCSGFGDQQLFAIDPTGTGDVTESHVKWSTKKGVPKSPSILLVGTLLFVVDDGGVASCFDAISGQVHWQERIGGKFSASPVYADGHVYFQDEDGKTTVIDASTEFNRIGTSQLGDGRSRTFASYAIIDRAILLRSETHLYRLED